MIKTLGVLLGGLFLGAVGMEIMRRKNPKGSEKIGNDVKNFGSSLKASFKDGYNSAKAPVSPAV
ncbi:MAG: hypothetical protein HQL31_07860 [Planctomycetes bacterium]|nr:hypothetical protein [Planctomycetota bacterium]